MYAIRSYYVWLIVALSILLDFFTAFFIGVIGEELRFRRHFLRPPAMVPAAPAAEAMSVPDSEPQPVTEAARAPLSAYQQVLQALRNGEVACSKTAVARQLALAGEEIDAIFHRLLEENIVLRKPNRHFELAGEPS